MDRDSSFSLSLVSVLEMDERSFFSRSSPPTTAFRGHSRMHASAAVVGGRPVRAFVLHRRLFRFAFPCLLSPVNGRALSRPGSSGNEGGSRQRLPHVLGNRGTLAHARSEGPTPAADGVPPQPCACARRLLVRERERALALSCPPQPGTAFQALARGELPLRADTPPLRRLTAVRSARAARPFRGAATARLADGAVALGGLAQSCRLLRPAGACAPPPAF